MRCLFSFPFLNTNAIFVVFAMGADDIFVAVDIWKSFRREMPRDLTTDQVALVALPKIAFATFVTSITTAAAFFASTGVKSPIIASFALFCGLLVMMDYVLSIAILFPSICVYDRWLAQGCKSKWVSFSSKKPVQVKMPDTDENDEVRRESEDWENVERGGGE
jgi:predicted RND superfamily exporter protein